MYVTMMVWINTNIKKVLDVCKTKFKVRTSKQKSINLVQMFELFGYIICTSMITIYIIIHIHGIINSKFWYSL